MTLVLHLAPRQWGVQPGHRLRLELTTQTPVEVCPETGLPSTLGTDPCRLTTPQQAPLPSGTYTILHGPKWPSALNLPQLPWQAFPEARAGRTPTACNENQRMLETGQFTLPLEWGSPRSGAE